MDEENANTSRKSALRHFFNSNQIEESEGENGPKDRIKIGPDRIFSKPYKVFTKENGRIHREIVDKDVLNVFDSLDSQPMSSGMRSGQ